MFRYFGVAMAAMVVTISPALSPRTRVPVTMSTVEVVSSRALTAEEAAAEVSAFVSRAQAESEAAALQGDNGEAAPPALVRGAGDSVDARRCLSVDIPPTFFVEVVVVKCQSRGSLLLSVPGRSQTM